MSPRAAAILMGIFATVLIAIGILAIGGNNKEASAQELQQEFLNCFNREVQESVEGCVEENVSSWMERFGEEATIEQLAYYEENFAEGPTCHAVGHIVGGELYKRQGDLSAISSCTDACLSSCLHGVQMAYAEKYGFQKLVQETIENNLCDKWNGNESQQQLCYHGLGHVFLTALDYDYLAAKELCNRLSPVDSVGEPSFMCLGGLFMELFLGSEIHAGREVAIKEEDPYYPCAEENLTTAEKHQCYVHIHFRLVKNDGQGKVGMPFCNEAPSTWQRSCSFGAGYVGYLYNLEDLGVVKSICRQADSRTNRNSCFEGALSYLTFANRAPAEIKRFCDGLSLDERSVCLTSAR